MFLSYWHIYSQNFFLKEGQASLNGLKKPLKIRKKESTPKSEFLGPAIILTELIIEL